MKRSTQTALAGLLLAGSTMAQTATGDLRIHRGRLRDAGTFHWSTKTWTRPARGPGFENLDRKVYDNTCFWTGLAANTILYNGVEACQDLYDEGRIPASGVAGATRDNNVVRFTFAHVTFAPVGTVDVELTFYDHLGGVCLGFASPTPPQPPSAGRVVLNTANGVTLPGDPGTTGTAWMITVDLTGGLAFCLQSDGDGTTGNGNDLFTWRYRHRNSIAPFGTNQGGPIVAGEPLKGHFGTCTYGMTGAQACGTDPGGVGPCGTGLGANDSFWDNLDGDVADGGGNNTSAICPQPFGTRCFFFGGWPGNPWGSHFLRIFSDDDCSCEGCSSSYCSAKTTSTGCVPFLTSSPFAPSVSSSLPYVIRSNDVVPDEAGLLLYGFKKANLNFHGGKLCIKAPVMRTGAKQAKSATCVNPCGTCTTSACGILSRDFNAVIQNGSDPLLTAGQSVFAQWRQRDPADPLGFGDNLSEGIQFLIAP